jgi:cellulose 1,4-beta-cellobiosidase
LTNFYDNNKCSSSLCSDSKIYSNKCVIDGADYSGTYDIATSENSLKLVFVTNRSCSTNIESRVYLLMDETNYQIFDFKNKELTFTVDDSNLDCGLNEALYFFQWMKMIEHQGFQSRKRMISMEQNIAIHNDHMIT